MGPGPAKTTPPHHPIGESHYHGGSSYRGTVFSPSESFQKLSLANSTESFPTSPLGKRILQRTRNIEQQQTLHVPQLPEDFLRIPCDVAVLRRNSLTGENEYRLVSEMEQIVLEEQQLQMNLNRDQIFSRSLCRNPQIGLGMTLCDTESFILVHSLISKDGNRWLIAPSHEEMGSPAIDAQILPGDLVLGVNGKAFVRKSLVGAASNGLFREVINEIQKSPEPVVFHLYRPESEEISLVPMQETSSLLRPTNVERGSNKRKTLVHPFAHVLAKRRLIHYGADEISVTQKLSQLSYSARQWNATSEKKVGHSGTFVSGSYRVGGEGMSHHSTSRFADTSFPGSKVGRYSEAPTDAKMSRNEDVSLFGVRRALCVRILNSFMEGNTRAYTIWVFDIESGSEWYAPVRNYGDFCDLRASTQLLSPLVSEISFPSAKWSVFGTNGKGASGRESDVCRKLEHFLRVLCSIVYREELRPGLVEVAIHVQSFLGCDIALRTPNRVDICVADAQYLPPNKAELQAKDVVLLKRSIQHHAHLVFLVDVMEQIVCQFVDEVQAKRKNSTDLMTPEKESFGAIKRKSRNELNIIRAFLDQLQEIIIEGCMADFESISRKTEFIRIREILDAEEGHLIWNQIVRDAVRERVEIEVYVPVRSVVSSHLVNGWKQDDTEINFKMQVLRNRPTGFFGIPGDRKDWISVSKILEDGVGRSTLPCVKLRAIVNASKEITRLYSGIKRTASVDYAESAHPSFPALGADDFLPIFIYCVVQARIERPCALCVLLSTLCDRASRIGEVGYYLSSFEAAIAHIKEIDLSDYG